MLSAAWASAGTCAIADGTLPIGDIGGVTVASNGTVWCAVDFYEAWRQLPAEMTETLCNAIDVTVAQCQLEAAKTL